MSCLTSTDVIIKQSEEILNVSMLFDELLADSVTISTIVSITSSPTGITVTNSGISDGLVYFTIADGVDGTNYTIQVKITTSSSETLMGEGLLKVRDR